MTVWRQALITGARGHARLPLLLVDIASFRNIPLAVRMINRLLREMVLGDP